jgi:hypothetical protein
VHPGRNRHGRHPPLRASGPLPAILIGQNRHEQKMIEHGHVSTVLERPGIEVEIAPPMTVPVGLFVPTGPYVELDSESF